MTVRPPWPDEMDRLRAFLPALRETKGFNRTWLWVLAADQPERILGAAALRERPSARIRHAPPPRGQLEWRIQPAWVNHPEAGRLMAAVVETAQQLQLSGIDCTEDPTTACAAVLLDAGFTAEGSVHQSWRVEPARVLEEFGPVILAGLRRRLPGPITPLQESDLPSVRALCAHFGLLSGDRVQLSPPAAAGFDPQLSFVYKQEDRVAAALLCRGFGRTVYLEIFARYAELAFTESSTIAGLLFSLLESCVQRGASELICAVRPEMTPELIGLLKRGHGSCLQSHQAFVHQTLHSPPVLPRPPSSPLSETSSK